MKNLPGQKKVCTVWLEPEIEGYSDKVKLFFCFNCRTPLIEYQGRVTQIVPGKTPYEPATILKCQGSVKTRAGEWENCGMYYMFMGSVYTANPENV